MDVSGKQSSEKRLIDADALLNEFLNRYTEREKDWNLVFAACEIKQDFADMISDVPTVDAVEVVKCRDCKFRSSWMMNRNLRYICPESGLFPNGESDFCSYGERNDGDSDAKAD